MSRFKSPQDFDRAIKQLAKNIGDFSGRTYHLVLKDRFLCRIFSSTEQQFILKGGLGLLARVPNSRATRDIDFALRKYEEPSSIIVHLNNLAKIDLDDFCRFEPLSFEKLVGETGNSRIYHVKYNAYLGDVKKDIVSIDLSLDCEITLPPDEIEPLNRLRIPGVKTFKYLVYPLPDQLADKFCAIVERSNLDYPSSRMKDLVDVIFYVTHYQVNQRDLRYAIDSECRRRLIVPPKEIVIPDAWKTIYAKFAQRNNSPEQYCDFESACNLAADFYNPVLGGLGTTEAKWSFELMRWV